MTVVTADLLKDLQGQVRQLEDDLREQVGRLPDLDERLRSDYAVAQRTERTAESWTAWLDAQVTQAAVSWVLGSVFVRFCEDNNLTDRRWIAGLTDDHGDGLARAVDAQAAWIQANPRDNERGWLRQAFTWLRSTHAGSSLFPETDFVWWWDTSADAAEALLGFFRRRDAEGQLVHRFDSPDWDTRFLGDLYQNLSEAARKRYALLQTPEFVEDFILDLTLDPALDRFGVDGFRMIDPACGSGHFLLGAFRRLLTVWTDQHPGLEARQRVQRALGSVHGVDVNPAATAIAKFRLTVAALRATDATGLDTPNAPGFKLNIATGDSLIWASGGRQTHAELIAGELTVDEHHYTWEDIDKHPAILRPGSYHAVVANPPYVRVTDKALSRIYRRHFKSCYRQYALSVPFAELLFTLAIRSQDRPGIVGQITSNSFMKREFGQKLIQDFFPTVDLTYVIDSEGAWIPGHNMDGTPTVILIGNRRFPRTATVRCLQSKGKRESRHHTNGTGPYWQGIVKNIYNPYFDNDWITVTDLDRNALASHPWLLSGGGAGDLQSLMSSTASSRLADAAESVGFGVITGEDAAFLAPFQSFRRKGVEQYRRFATGDSLRDYRVAHGEEAVWPYNTDLEPRYLTQDSPTFRLLWPVKRALQVRRRFGVPVEQIEDLRWYEYREFYRKRFRTPLSIAYAEVATHNHFVLDDRATVFNQTSPVIKLSDLAKRIDYLQLLGILNSSIACFWMRNRCKQKGGAADRPWARTYQFNARSLEEFPVLQHVAYERTQKMELLAQELSAATPRTLAAAMTPDRETLDSGKLRWELIRAQMISLQEELDWEIYRAYGVLDEELTHQGDDLPEITHGERAFEILLARKVKDGEAGDEWFEHHHSIPITEIPDHWPQNYQDLVARRIELIESHPLLHLVEKPECKRRWESQSWEEMQRDALSEWILDRLEAAGLWQDADGSRVLSVAQLADLVRGDSDMRNVLVLLTGRPDLDFTNELERLLKDESVPFLAAYRYKEVGMRKRAAWEETWRLQRREDAGERISDIPVPPKYKQADFRRPAIARQRGELDMPTERLIVYPAAGRDSDKTAVVGWAGWDHLQQAQALARLILDRSQQEGWDATRLTPLLAGIMELEPWLHQWYTDIDPAYGGSPASFYTTFLDEQLQKHGLTREDLTRWRPEPTRGRRTSR